MNKIIEKFMLFVGSASSLVYYLQGFKIFNDRSATDVSLWAFLIGLFCLSCWTIYGYIIKNRVVFISNILAAVGALFVIIGILYFS